MKIDSIDSMYQTGEKLLDFGSKSVIMKGGHLPETEAINILFKNDGSEPYIMKSVWVDTNNTHGTGCTLSSALASYLALDNTLENSALLAKEYVHNALKAGADIKTGKGHGPLNHFFNPQKLCISK